MRCSPPNATRQPVSPTDIFETGYSTNQDGTGFGLNIVQHIVSAHDWEIAVAEGTDGWARFEITGVEFVTD